MVLDETQLSNIWETTLSRLERVINDSIAFSAYFNGSYIKVVDDNTIAVVVPSRLAVKVLNEKFFNDVQNEINDVTQTNFKIQITDDESARNQKDIIRVNDTGFDKPFDSHLNNRLVFESFVVGPSNRESYTAALSAAMDPGHFFNPLFIFGKSGLGKTHLLHAIGNFIKQKNPNAKVLYLSTDDFFENYVKAVKEKSVEELKDSYRNIDVFLLDDVQFLSSKEKTKEIFFHIFNILTGGNKQIVLTADRPPVELKDLEERLVGRFSSGLSVEIQALEYDTALKILYKKVENQNLNDGKIDDDVLEFVAKNYSSDVRQLEGALNKLLFYAITYNKKTDIDLQTAMGAFAGSSFSGKRPVTIEKIKYCVAEYYNISVSQLTSKIRQTNLVIPRHIAMYLCKSELNTTLSEIGREFGGKDHTTVINAISNVDNKLKSEPEYLNIINELKKIINQ